MTRVLVVEDENALRDVIVRTLRFEGYEASGVRDGNEALGAVRAAIPDVIVTDIRMPSLGGIELVEALRDDPATRLIPIIMLTAVPDRTSHRQSMELGADDYITKPFEMDELLGAIAAQLRRRQWLKDFDAADDDEGIVEFAHWRYDMYSRVLRATDGSGAERRLTLTEARLLCALLDHAGRPIGRQELLTLMGRPAAAPEDRSVDVFVTHLRRKIEPDPRNPTLLRTIRSAGYVFDLPRDGIRRRASGRPGGT